MRATWAPTRGGRDPSNVRIWCSCALLVDFIDYYDDEKIKENAQPIKTSADNGIMNGTSIYSERYHRHTPWRPAAGDRPQPRTSPALAHPAMADSGAIIPATIDSAPTSPAPTNLAPTNSTTTRPAPFPTAASEASLFAILDAPLREGETARIGFARKEKELGTAFAALPVVDQLALAKRLALPCTGDRLAEKFGRLTTDRRERLIQFLQDARRRAALTKGRG